MSITVRIKTVFLKHFKIKDGLKLTNTKQAIDKVKIIEKYVFIFSAFFELNKKDNKTKNIVVKNANVKYDGTGIRFLSLTLVKKPILIFETAITKKQMNAMMYKIIFVLDDAPKVT